MTLEAYRVDNGVAVDDATAQEAWSRAARPILVQVARRFGSLTTPKDLGEAVQVLSGVRTREPAEQWIADTLDSVDVECVARQEPLLSSFCVGDDGRIGERYAQRAARLDPAAATTDIEMHAAKQRLGAHQCHGAVLPVDGGRPALPRQLAAQRVAAPKRATRHGVDSHEGPGRPQAEEARPSEATGVPDLLLATSRHRALRQLRS